MKHLCLLVTLLILLVSAAPCCPDSGGDQEGKIAQQEHRGDQHPEEEDGRACSPFLTCGTCSGFIKPLPAFIPHDGVKSQAGPMVAAYHLSYYPLVPAPIWQPPKLG